MPTTDRALRLIVLGGCNVGKSALVVRYLTHTFTWDHKSASDLLYKIVVNIDGQDKDVHVLDSSVYSEDTVSVDTFTRQILWADAFLVLYSVCGKVSLKRARSCISSIRALRGADPVIGLLGNKADMKTRTVTVADGQDLAREYNCRFHELSVATGYKPVVAAVHDVLREANKAALTMSRLAARGRPANRIARFLTKLFGARGHDDGGIKVHSAKLMKHTQLS